MVKAQKSMSVDSGSIGPNYIAPIPTKTRDWDFANLVIEKSIPGLQSLVFSLYRCLDYSLTYLLSFCRYPCSHCSTTKTTKMQPSHTDCIWFRARSSMQTYNVLTTVKFSGRHCASLRVNDQQHQRVAATRRLT